MRFGLAPCRHLIGLPLLHSGHSLINASDRNAHVTKPIYPESARIGTASDEVVNNCDNTSTFKSIGEIGAAVIKRLGKRLGK